jgi:hypothetical protein
MPSHIEGGVKRNKKLFVQKVKIGHRINKENHHEDLILHQKTVSLRKIKSWAISKRRFDIFYIISTED